MNKVTLTGNVGKDLNVRTFENGKLASFTMVTKETYKNRNNEEVESKMWHNLVAFGKVADVCERLITKGKKVSIEGKLNYRSYKNKEVVRLANSMGHSVCRRGGDGCQSRWHWRERGVVH